MKPTVNIQRVQHIANDELQSFAAFHDASRDALYNAVMNIGFTVQASIYIQYEL